MREDLGPLTTLRGDEDLRRRRALAFEADGHAELRVLGNLLEEADRRRAARHDRALLRAAEGDRPDEGVVGRRRVVTRRDRGPVDDAHPVDHRRHLLALEGGRAAEGEEEVVLARLHLVGGEREVVLLEVVRPVELQRLELLVVQVRGHGLGADRLDPDADRARPGLLRVEVDPPTLTDGRVGRIAVGSAPAPAAAPVAEGVLVLGRGAEVDEQAVVLHVGQMDLGQEVLMHRQALEAGAPGAGAGRAPRATAALVLPTAGGQDRGKNRCHHPLLPRHRASTWGARPITERMTPPGHACSCARV